MPTKVPVMDTREAPKWCRPCGRCFMQAGDPSESSRTSQRQTKRRKIKIKEKLKVLWRKLLRNGHEIQSRWRGSKPKMKSGLSFDLVRVDGGQTYPGVLGKIRRTIVLGLREEDIILSIHFKLLTNQRRTYYVLLLSYLLDLLGLKNPSCRFIWK